MNQQEALLVYRWPDDTWCLVEEFTKNDYRHMSDDYETIMVSEWEDDGTPIWPVTGDAYIAQTITNLIKNKVFLEIFTSNGSGKFRVNAVPREGHFAFTGSNISLEAALREVVNMMRKS